MDNSRSRKETTSFHHLKTRKDFYIAVTRVSGDYAFHVRGTETA